MTHWREELEAKRKKQERQRALLDQLAADKRAAIQTGREFVARKDAEHYEAGIFGNRPPAERLLDAFPDAERRETPAGPCVVRRIEIPVDLETRAAPLDFSLLLPEPSGGSTGESPAASVLRPFAHAPNSLGGRRAGRTTAPTPDADFSDVWPDDLEALAARTRRRREAAPEDDGTDAPPPETFERESCPDDDIAPPPRPYESDDILDDIPRFRRSLSRARRDRKPTPPPADPADRFPPIAYACRPGAPPATATPERLRQLATDAPPDTPLPLERILFLDTETTGLAGGAGTFPFLIGVGFFERLDTPRPVFVVEQYFMEDFCYEEAQLALLNERLRGFDALCTYNGKTFDVPILRTRHVFNRRPPSAWDLPHIDLLPIARRFWRRTLPSVTLATVERVVLGHLRERDIDGSLIPRLYFQFTRGVRPEQMVPVFDHNVQDIASLGALIVRVCAYLENPEHPALRLPGELTGLGLWLERHGRAEEAARCLERAVAVSTDPDEQDRLLLHIARRHKRHGRWSEALDVWQRLLDRPIATALQAAVELAKYWEHRAKDPERAAAVVRTAIDRIEKDESRRTLLGRSAAPAPRQSPAQWIEALEHRLTRLERRRAKSKTTPNPKTAAPPSPQD